MPGNSQRKGAVRKNEKVKVAHESVVNADSKESGERGEI